MEKLAVAENFPNTAMTVITMGRSDGQTKNKLHIYYGVHFLLDIAFNRFSFYRTIFLGKLIFKIINEKAYKYLLV